MTTKAKEVDAKDIPEVAEFIDAEAKVNEFKEQFADVFEQFKGLVVERNEKLEAAEKVVRAHQVTCGPFELYQHQTKYKAKEFFDAVGRDDFLKLGGSISTVPKYEIDKKVFEAMVAQKKIPPSVAETVVEVSPRWHVPNKIVL